MKLNPPLKLSYIAKMLQAEVAGDPELVLTGLNEIHLVEPGDLSFADHPKYIEKALQSKASAIIVNTRLSPPEGKALLIHPKPFEAFIRLIQLFRPFEPLINTISPNAKIGKGTIVQPGAVIGNHVTIGENCIIHANVTLYDHTVIGDRVIIHANSVIGADGFYFKKSENSYDKFESGGRVVIEDEVEIGALCSIDRGVTGDTFIGKGTKMDNHCQIGHDTVIGRRCIIGAHAAIAGVTRIEDEVVLWGRVSVNKDLVIGKGAIILATSAVDKSLEGGKTYFGVPAIEARKKWRELAALRQLPDRLQDLGK